MEKTGLGLVSRICACLFDLDGKSLARTESVLFWPHALSNSRRERPGTLRRRIPSMGWASEKTRLWQLGALWNFNNRQGD